MAPRSVNPLNANVSSKLPPSGSFTVNPEREIFTAFVIDWLLVVVNELGETLRVYTGPSLVAVTNTEDLLLPAMKVAVALDAALLSVMLRMSNVRTPGVGLSIFAFR